MKGILKIPSNCEINAIHSTEIMNYRFYHCILIICCLGMISSLSAQTASETAGCAPLSVNFTAPDNATSFFWDFKDGSSSDNQNPTNTFINAGTYEVAFSDVQGGTIVGTITVNVYETPTLMITQDPEIGCAPANIILTNSTIIPDGIDLLSTSWTFPDGTGAVGNSTNKDYAIAGQYSVTMSITTSSTNCNNSANFTDFITVKTAPSTAFSISPDATACNAPHTVTFGNDTPGNDLTYLWDLGNGNVSSEENPPNQTYEEEGTYEVSLTATNEDGCSKTVMQKISIGSPVADFALPDTVCVGTEVGFQNLSSAGSYIWTISGPSSITLSGASPTYTFPTEGTYQINLNVTASGGECTNNITKTVFAQNVDATFAAAPIYACSEPMAVTFTPQFPIEGATYSWEFGDDSTGSEASPIHDYNADNESPYHPNGEFKYNPKLTLSTSAGCMAEFQTEVILDIPLSRFMPDTVSGCAPLTVAFSDSSRSTQAIANWEWLYADGNTQNFDTGDAHSYTYNEAGEYDVQLVITNDLGCQDTSYIIRVEVGERITPDFTVDKMDACIGEAIQFTDLSNNTNIDEWHYYTDNDRSSHCYSDANPILTFETETGAFDATLVVGYNGCLDSITKPDFVNIRGPIAHIDFMMSCDTPNTVMFTSSSMDATTLAWDFGDMTTGSAEMETHDYETTGDYTVILTAENSSTGCAASSDTTLIQIRNIKADGPVDLLQCKDQPLMLNSESSTDVDTSCFRGYTWFFNHPGVRPVTTNETKVEDISYPDTGMYSVDLVVEDVNGCTDTARYPVIVHEVIVSFDVDKTEICIPQTVQISNVQATTTSQTIESFMWDFGDGVGMSEESNPGSYTYSIPPEADRITISVQVEDDAGCPGSAEQTMDFYQPTSQIIAGDLSICAGDDVMVRGTPFIRNGQNRPLSYDWSLGNGQTSNEIEATATYNEGGMYTITLDYEEIATGCGGTATIAVVVQDYPVAAFTSDVDGMAELCAPATVTFSDNSTSLVPLSQSWDFGNGGAGVGSNVQASFVPGTFPVTLIVRTSNGCDDQLTREFKFDEGPEAGIQLSGTSFCVGDQVTATIIDTARVRGFSWEFEGNTFGENEESVTITISQIPLDGQAPIKLNLDGIGDCNTAVSENIQVNSVNPDFSTQIDPCDVIVNFQNLTEGNNNLNWDFGDGNSSIEVNPTYTYSNTGVYIVTLTATDMNTGCINSIAKTVSVGTVETTGGFSATPNGCMPVEFAIDESFLEEFSSFTFDYGDGSIGTSLNHLYPDFGEYTVLLMGESNEGCLSETISQQLIITSNEGINVTFDSDQIQCKTVEITNISNLEEISSYELDYGDGKERTQSLTYTYDNIGTYTITIFPIDNDGCPLNIFSKDQQLDPDFDAGGGKPIYVPNAFTPSTGNGDGLNDNFKISSTPLKGEGCREIQFVLSYRIFNRWGKTVYSNDDSFEFPTEDNPNPNNGNTDEPSWNGSDNPTTIDNNTEFYPTGVYVYAIEVLYADGEGGILKGDVTLIR